MVKFIIIYNNQMLLHSDRITLNSKLMIFFIIYNDIHIGTKRHLTISTNEDLIISSRKNIFW